MQCDDERHSRSDSVDAALRVGSGSCAGKSHVLTKRRGPPCAAPGSWAACGWEISQRRRWIMNSECEWTRTRRHVAKTWEAWCSGRCVTSPVLRVRHKHSAMCAAAVTRGAGRVFGRSDVRSGCCAGMDQAQPAQLSLAQSALRTLQNADVCDVECVRLACGITWPEDRHQWTGTQNSRVLEE
jgi:hypothetical protein